MGHKEFKVLLGLSFIAIVVPLVSQVNAPDQNLPSNATSPVRIADGNPGPPVPPPPTELGLQPNTQPIVVADGNPGPPFPPPTKQIGAEPVLIADGNPGPPVPPPRLTQDGNQYAV